jgi:hypothetical protein
LKAKSGEGPLLLGWMIATLLASQRIELLVLLLYTEYFSDLQLRHNHPLLWLHNIFACTLLCPLALSIPPDVAHRARLPIDQATHVPIPWRPQVCWLVALIPQIVIFSAGIPDKTQTGRLQRIFLVHRVLHVDKPSIIMRVIWFRIYNHWGLEGRHYLLVLWHQVATNDGNIGGILWLLSWTWHLWFVLLGIVVPHCLNLLLLKHQKLCIILWFFNEGIMLRHFRPGWRRKRAGFLRFLSLIKVQSYGLGLRMDCQSFILGWLLIVAQCEFVGFDGMPLLKTSWVHDMIIEGSSLEKDLAIWALHVRSSINHHLARLIKLQLCVWDVIACSFLRCWHIVGVGICARQLCLSISIWE